jgi:hypothetical protein
VLCDMGCVGCRVWGVGCGVRGVEIGFRGKDESKDVGNLDVGCRL